MAPADHCLCILIPRQTILQVLLGLCAGLLYGQARGLLADPRAKDLVRRVVDSLGASCGQRFITQAGETAGLLLRQLERLGPDMQASIGLNAAQLQADIRSTLIGVFNTRVDACAPLLSLKLTGRSSCACKRCELECRKSCI